MKNITVSNSVAALAVTLVAVISIVLFTSPVQASPKRHKHTPTKAKSKKKHERKLQPKLNKVSRADKKPKPLAGDVQTQVNLGQRLAFFDPNDLSKPPVLSAKSAILEDADTGQVLWEKNADDKHFPASTTKILTALLFIEHSKPTDVITCTDPNIRKIEESSLHIQPWEKFTAKDLLYGLLLRSANDGAVVVAEHVAGSVPRFAQMMNQRARQIGATKSHFMNPNGLHDPDHYTTARDLALIARTALANPRFSDAVEIPRRVIARSKVVRDVVVMSKAHKFYESFPGADGVKTGYTRISGNCFVGSATRGNRRLLSVILAARSNASGETIPLLSWGFRRFPAVYVARQGAPVGVVRVLNGQQGEVPVVAARDLRVSTASSTPLVASSVEGKPDLQAPVKKGQEVGRLVAKVDGKPIAAVPLLAQSDVSPTLVRAATGTVNGWFFIILGAFLLVLIGWIYGTASAKSARRRRNRIKAARRKYYSGGADSG